LWVRDRSPDYKKRTDRGASLDCTAAIALRRLVSAGRAHSRRDKRAPLRVPSHVSVGLSKDANMSFVALLPPKSLELGSNGMLQRAFHELELSQMLHQVSLLQKT